MVTLLRRIRLFPRSIDAWLFRNIPPHALGLFRLLFGLFLLLYWFTKASQVTMLFSREGIILPLFGEHPHSILTLLFTPPSPQVAWALYFFMLVSLFLFAIGWKSRLFGIVAALLTCYYWHLSLHLFDTSFDRLFMFFLTVLAIDGADKAFTLPLWLKEKKIAKDVSVSAFAQRLLTIQITVTYFGVGWQKLIIPKWDGAEVLWYSFQNTWATPFAFWFASLMLPMWFFAGVVFIVKIFECTIPLGLWKKSMQPWFFAYGTLFHLLITLFLGMWWFLALPFTYLLFLDPFSVARTLESRFARKRRAS